MASTDAKSGFRLPWSTDRNDTDEPGTNPADPTADQAQPQSADEAPVSETLDSAQDNGSAVSSDPAPQSDTPPAAAPRKPNKFMADLTKAMQTAAEAARADVLEKFSAEAKAHIEGIHAGSADEATALRKKADDDIAGVREWSKNEIARIREETDERIAHRKEVLEREIEAHAAQIEARIERIQSRVTSFEGEMDYFFERLLAEDDPTRFAAMAETLPEPPAFDVDDVGTDWSASTATVEAPADPETPATNDDWGAPEAAQETNEHAADTAEATTVADPAPESTGWEAEAPAAEPAVADDAPVAEAAVAIAEAPEAGATADLAPETAPEARNEDTGDLFGIAADAPATDVDPRLSALGMDQDFAAAEAEAGAFTADATTDEEEIPVIAEDALAARLAGLVAEEPAAPTDAVSTRVVVTGLVSVASIAGFKRNLSRVTGVRSVGVSSGPDGEFVFAVTHDPGLDLNDGIATLPGFGARVTNEAPGELTVAARDPESEG
jgi:hypothetical protein